jgi:hypothetical protein
VDFEPLASFDTTYMDDSLNHDYYSNSHGMDSKRFAFLCPLPPQG